MHLDGESSSCPGSFSFNLNVVAILHQEFLWLVPGLVVSFPAVRQQVNLSAAGHSVCFIYLSSTGVVTAWLYQCQFSHHTVVVDIVSTTLRTVASLLIYPVNLMSLKEPIKIIRYFNSKVNSFHTVEVIPLIKELERVINSNVKLLVSDVDLQDRCS